MPDSMTVQSKEALRFSDSISGLRYAVAYYEKDLPNLEYIHARLPDSGLGKCIEDGRALLFEFRERLIELSDVAD